MPKAESLFESFQFEREKREQRNMSDQNVQQQTPATPPVFSAAKKFRVPIFSGGRKECLVRFPSDEEWCARARKQRSLRTFLGRGKSQAKEIDSSVPNAELFQRIRLDGPEAPSFTAAEAGAVLEKLERASIEAVEREGNDFRILLKVPGAMTAHLVRMPDREQMDKHEAASVSVIGQRRSQEIRGFLEPSGALYDEIVKEASGYDGPVPIVHKVAIVSEVLAQVAIEDEDPIPE